MYPISIPQQLPPTWAITTLLQCPNLRHKRILINGTSLNQVCRTAHQQDQHQQQYQPSSIKLPNSLR